MSKLLIICGPTATGKTNLALQLAKAFNGELVSADSRQVYKGMDIATGKDLPNKVKSQKSKVKINQQSIHYYLVDSIRIWGYDLVKPSEAFSVADYIKITHQIIIDIWQRGKLPIIVGGTGLYINSLLTPPPSISIPPDKKLRQRLNKLNVLDLQQQLIKLNPHRFHQMNESDRCNPRRLIRAIEIANSKFPQPHQIQPSSSLWIGLTAPITAIDQRIFKRVTDRIQNGMTEEVKRLINKYPDWSLPAFSATGYRQWRNYLEGKTTKKQAIKLWQQSEHQYARRQLTWFKTNPNINWFDITQKNFKLELVEKVKNWYAKSKS